MLSYEAPFRKPLREEEESDRPEIASKAESPFKGPSADTGGPNMVKKKTMKIKKKS